MTSTAETYDDLILANLSGNFSRQAAEGILSLKFSVTQQDRMSVLTEKARSGHLTENEQEELVSYERISSLLGILQSKARMSFQDSDS